MIRVFAFDLEGTILCGQPRPVPEAPPQHALGMWPLLMQELGEEAIQKDRLLANRWDAGQFSNYVDWCDASLHMMARRGLNRALFERVMKLFSISEGVSELVADLHRKNIHLAIVSGGFYEQARRAQEILAIRHCYAAVDLSWNAVGDLASWNLFPSGPNGKLGFLRLIAA